MGHVPTHGPDCRKVAAHPTRCNRCGLLVVYFECTCGSKVFLDPAVGGSPHDCRRGTTELSENELRRKRAGFVSSEPVVCPFCHNAVKSERLATHLKKCPR